ncbi:hypothetical protein HYW54_02650 [Candidatus Gottesmanbacteria bacterium]|nr:hypothetical protein [Candidatus Gottesmanbacteria bacterium]
MKIAQRLEINGTPIEGPLPTISGQPGVYKFTTLASIINAAVPILFAFSGIALFIYLVWGGFDYLTSMGDPKKAEQGKNRITHAVVGFIIMFVAFWVVQVMDIFLGFEIF